MTVRLSASQSELLCELSKAGERGVFKATSNRPAFVLVREGYARWTRKFDLGAMGTLVITERGVNFRAGHL